MGLVREPGAPAPYQQIQRILREEILAGKGAGDRIAPERELAKRFGANRATVSRAIGWLVKEGLLIRRVGRGTFVSGGGEGPARARTSTVGLVMPYISGVFPSRIIRSAVRSLKERRYKTVLFDSEDSVMAESDELERLAQGGLDGALIMPVEKPDNISVFAGLLRFGLPLVFLDRKPLGLEGDLVGSDNFRGAYDATSRLIERGHRRIAHFTWLVERTCTSIEQRRRGYEQALIDHGIEVDPELMCPPASFPDESLYFKYTLAYLRRDDRPVTAVFCLHDQFVLRTIDAASALGLRIPDDIEVAGYFDESFHPLDDVAVLKVIQGQDQIGELAAGLLISRIEGGGPDGYQEITVVPEIVDPLSGSR